MGILGGGQLGKMLLQVCNSWDIHTEVLDPYKEPPARFLCQKYHQGDYTDYQTVKKFGQNLDLITIEIENVNTDALNSLQNQGKLISPNPATVATIQDKGNQKSFFFRNNLPTAPCRFFTNAHEIHISIQKQQINFPFVQKLRTGGYDGYGVQVIHNQGNLNKLFDAPSIVEPLVSIQKELSVIIARSRSGEIKVFPMVEMVFHPTANLVEYLLCPAHVSDSVVKDANDIAHTLVESLSFVGLLAVEFFLTDNNELLINEIAPRPHNSGHHTIESCVTSQYEQLLRAILGFPLGSTKLRTPAVMLNILGEDGHDGNVKYLGIPECLNIEGVKIHVYGKKHIRPFRKMGHVTIVDENLEHAIQKAEQVKQLLKAVSA